jgi:nucleoid-associated protein YgaU
MRDVATGTLAVLALLSLVIGVPLALAASVGWPLPTTVPDPEVVGNALRYGTIAPATMLKSLAVVVWVTWMLMTTTIVVEVAAIARGTVARALPTLGGLQNIAARLVTTAMMLSTLTARPAVAAPLPPVVAVTAPVSEDGEIIPEEEAGAPSTWQVQRHDSLWTIAERTLGDGHRWREIHELNVGRRQPDGGRLAAGDMMIRPGWALRLPADAGPDQTGTAQVKVGRGDHLWGLAEQHLGDGERWRDIYERNAGRPQPDGRALSRPDTIHPGWVLDLPDVPSTRVAKEPVRGDDESTDRAEPDHLDRAPGDDNRAAQTGARRDAQAPVAPLPVTPATLFGAGWPDASESSRTVGQSTATPEPALVAATVTEDDSDVLPIAGIAILATGLVGVLTLRRRHWLRQRRAGSALPPVDPEAAEVERWLRAMADHDLIHRTERVLRVLAEHFALHEVDAVVLAVEFGDRVRLRLSGTHPHPPPGITASDEGRTWTLDPEFEVTVPMDAGGPLLTPALVCCGQRPSGEMVALNLLAAGVLDVAGADEHVNEAVTSWTAELATKATAGVEVIVVGAHHDLVEQFATVTITDDADAALDRIDRARDAAGVVVLSCTAAEGRAWEALRERALDDPRIAVVSPGQPDAVHRVQIDGDHVVLTPDGTSLERPDWLTPDNWDRFDELLRQPVRQQPSDLVPSPLLSSPFDGHLTQIDDEGHTPERVVRLLGPFEVDGLPTPETSTWDLLAFLAVHREGVTAETLARDCGQDAEQTAALVAGISDALGCDDNDRPLLTVDDDGRHRLSNDVACDIDRLHELARRLSQMPPATQAQRLTDALELVRGIPFQGAGGWAHAEGMVTATTALVSDLAHRLATLVMTFGDLERASWAVDQGLLANPGCELLYRDRMRIADARGDHALLDTLMHEVRRQAEAEHGWVTPETLQLYERLKRSTRITAAPADDHRHAS